MITLPHVNTNVIPIPTKIELTHKLKPMNAMIGITLIPASTIIYDFIIFIHSFFVFWVGPKNINNPKKHDQLASIFISFSGIKKFCGSSGDLFGL
jgi:hypothetical protein